MKGVFLDSKNLDELDLTTLKAQFSSLDIYENTEPPEVLSRIKEAEVVITNKVNLTAETISQLPDLKLICVVATGVNNVDLEAAQQHKIAVFNCQAYGVASVVQHTFALILALQTNLVNYHNAVQEGRWQTSEQFCFLDYPVAELNGKVMGVIGFGNLGQGVAKIAEAFGMTVKVAARDSNDQRADRVPLNVLLAEADVLSLHCPLTPETTNLISKKELGLMKPSAVLVNVARGGVVNESDLICALKQGEIAAAATDVLTVEPPKDGNPLLDETLPNLIVTPHSAWGSEEARQRIIDQTVENIQYYLNQTASERRVV